MELEQDHYDVVVIGTGLAESIAAASLANSGKSVLHLDPNEYYGASQASLTLDELETWLSAHTTSHSSEGSSPIAGSKSTSRPKILNSSYSPSPLPTTLAAQKRQYALSLYPALLPSRGSLIQTLIDSGVSKYVGFRLLDGVSVWQEQDEAIVEALGGGGEEVEGSGGKRRGGGQGKGTGAGKATRVAGSKEEVFKDKSVSLVDKRRLMRFLMFVAGEYEKDAAYAGKEETPIIDLLTSTFSLPPSLAQRIAYAISHCSSLSEPSSSALERTRRYLKSIGRYGPAAFLVGQYGGAGEIAQGFCRACAVKGGTYVLGSQAIPSHVERIDSVSPPNTSNAKSDVSPAASNSDTAKWRLSLPCHPRPITASHIITAPENMPAALLPSHEDGDGPAAAPAIRTKRDDSSSSSSRHVLHGIAILPSLPECLKRPHNGKAGEVDAAEESETGDDTGVILFPSSADPGSGVVAEAEAGVGLVRALVMGEGTGSCPAGQYIVYLSAESPSLGSQADPESVLQPYLHRLHPTPLFEAYYTLSTPPAPSSGLSYDTQASKGFHVIRPFGGSGEMTEGLDWLAEEGKRMWEAVMGRPAIGFAVSGAVGMQTGAETGGVNGGEAESTSKKREEDEGWWAGMGEREEEEGL